MIQAVRKHSWMTFFASLALLFAAVQTVGTQVPTGVWLVEGSRAIGFVLSDMRLEGQVRTSEKELLAKLDMDLGTPLLAIDVKAARQSLETLPWVKKASVTRRFPGQLVIEIEERQPFALWQLNGRLHLMDRQGVPIDGIDITPYLGRRLYVGVGADRAAVKLEAALKLVPELNEKLKTAVRVGERRWDLIFDGGVRLKMPEDAVRSVFESKLKKFEWLNEQYALLERDVVIIDLRMDDRLILRVNPDVKPRVQPDFSRT